MFVMYLREILIRLLIAFDLVTLTAIWVVSQANVFV